jgi:hypothetical protein
VSCACAEEIDLFISGSKTREASVDFSDNTVYYRIHLDAAGLISSVSISKNGRKENAAPMLGINRDNNNYVLTFQQNDSQKTYVRFSSGKAGRIDIEEVYTNSVKKDAKTRTVEYSVIEDSNELLISEGSSRIIAVLGRSLEYIHTDFDYTFREFFNGILFAERSEIATKWEYYRNKSGMIVAQEYWNYDVVPPGGSFYAGTRSGYKGSLLYSKDPVVLVINYVILEQIFRSNTLYFFGYSLFNIPVYQGP